MGFKDTALRNVKSKTGSITDYSVKKGEASNVVFIFKYLNLCCCTHYN